jgi:general secretion pathway protein D
MGRSMAFAVMAGLLSSSALYAADLNAESKPASESIASDGTGIPLSQLVEMVAKREHLRFIVDPRLHENAVIVGFNAEHIAYSDLQAILRVHGFVAMRIGDSISIMPDANERSWPMPVIDRPTTGLSDEDVVMSIVSVGKLNAASLVPILRPMLPQAAQLSADVQTNSLILVDRYANIKKMESLIHGLESRPLAEKTPAQPRSETGSQ